jgi:hypothetical protein
MLRGSRFSVPTGMFWSNCIEHIRTEAVVGWHGCRCEILCDVCAEKLRKRRLQSFFAASRGSLDPFRKFIRQPLPSPVNNTLEETPLKSKCGRRLRLRPHLEFLYAFSNDRGLGIAKRGCQRNFRVDPWRLGTLNEVHHPLPTNRSAHPFC